MLKIAVIKYCEILHNKMDTHKKYQIIPSSNVLTTHMDNFNTVMIYKCVRDNLKKQKNIKKKLKKKKEQKKTIKDKSTKKTKKIKNKKKYSKDKKSKKIAKRKNKDKRIAKKSKDKNNKKKLKK